MRSPNDKPPALQGEGSNVEQLAGGNDVLTVPREHVGSQQDTNDALTGGVA